MCASGFIGHLLSHKTPCPEVLPDLSLHSDLEIHQKSFSIMTPVHSRKSSSGKCVQKFTLRHFLYHHFSMFDQQADSIASCNSNITSLASPGPFTTQPITATLISRDILNHSLHLVCKADQIDLGSSAGRTGNNLHAAFTESQCLKDTSGRFYFFQRAHLSGKRGWYHRFPDTG